MRAAAVSGAIPVSAALANLCAPGAGIPQVNMIESAGLHSCSGARLRAILHPRDGITTQSAMAW